MPRPNPLEELAARLDLDVDRINICIACLSFVSIPLGHGDERTARREARKMAPMLWEEGLAEPALAAVRKARDEGVPGAEAALGELEQRGGDSAAARAIVLRLAADEAAHAHVRHRLLAAALPRLRAARPESN